MIKKMSICLFIIMTLFMLTAPVFADPPGMTQMQGVNNFTSGTETATKIGNQILGIIYVVGVIISVAVIMIVGIKYIIASPEGKADIKGQAVPYIIGAILTFGSVSIAKAIANMGDKLSGT